MCTIPSGNHGGRRNSIGGFNGEDNMEGTGYLFLRWGLFIYPLPQGEVYFDLNADKICRATAQMLLQNAVKFNLAEFQEVWQQSVPEGMLTRLDQLKVR